MKNDQVKKLKEPARLSARCTPASKIFCCCSNSSRFSTSFMTAAFHLVPLKNNSRPTAHCRASLFDASGVRVVRRVRRHVEMPYVEVIRRAHLADGVFERIVGRHRSERALDVPGMIRTMRADITIREITM